MGSFTLAIYNELGKADADIRSLACSSDPELHGLLGRRVDYEFLLGVVVGGSSSDSFDIGPMGQFSQGEAADIFELFQPGLPNVVGISAEIIDSLVGQLEIDRELDHTVVFEEGERSSKLEVLGDIGEHVSHGLQLLGFLEVEEQLLVSGDSLLLQREGAIALLVENMGVVQYNTSIAHNGLKLLISLGHIEDIHQQPEPAQEGLVQLALLAECLQRIGGAWS